MLKNVLFVILCASFACSSTEQQVASESSVNDSFVALLSFSEGIPVNVAYFEEVMSLEEKDVKKWLASQDIDASQYYKLLEDLRLSIKKYANQQEIDITSGTAKDVIFHDDLSEDMASAIVEENGPYKCYIPFMGELKETALELSARFEKVTDGAAKSYLISWIGANINYTNCLEENFTPVFQSNH